MKAIVRIHQRVEVPEGATHYHPFFNGLEGDIVWLRIEKDGFRSYWEPKEALGIGWKPSQNPGLQAIAIDFDV